MATEALVMCKVSYSAVRAGYLLREPPGTPHHARRWCCKKRRKKKKYNTTERSVRIIMRRTMKKKLMTKRHTSNYHHYTHLSSQNNKGYASFTMIVHQRKSEIKSRSIMNSIRTYNT